MTDAERFAAGAILATELAIVTPEMLDAGSRALEESTLLGGHGRQFRADHSTDGELMRVWLAMLSAKLGAPAETEQQRTRRLVGGERMSP